MNKAQKIIIASLISLGTLGGLTSYAMAFGGHGKDRTMRADFIVYRISSKLDLNDDQKTKLESLKTTITDLIQARKESNSRDKAKELLSASVLDQEKALALFEERQTKILETVPSVITVLATFTDSLTEEQRATLLEIMDKFGNHQGRHGHHLGRGFTRGFGNNQ